MVQLVRAGVRRVPEMQRHLTAMDAAVREREDVQNPDDR